MKAPHFDGSDATNWISRVNYYFDHLGMAEFERLHYVVMLFRPPAAEWIFNYRENNPVVTWREFLEDVRHRFDPPKKCIQLRVSDYKPRPPTGWPLRRQLPPLHQPTCWDPPKQQEYSSHEPPTHVDPLDRGFVKFGPLPQPPLPDRFRSEVDEGRCYGEVITHTHSPTRDGDGELCDSEDSILDAELCDSENSILEAVAKKLMDRGLPSENWGSREGRDGRLEDQQVPSFDEIDPPCSPDMSKETEEEALLDDVEEVDSIEEVKKAVVARVTSQDVVENCLGEKGELHDSDVARMFQRPTLLAIDARMVPPRNYTACLGVRGRVNKLHVLALNFDDCFDPTLMIFYGEGEVTRPTIRYAFDPGGDASPSFCFQLSSLVRGSHLEDKVDFNRGGVDTSILSLFISLDILGICISFLIFVSCSLS